ncbi:nicotinate-nicotinamide nucleotide adenylyltransferase [Vibrio metschnikovii]|uniref:nicotinate-nicotinamide nucleotide adenylyltransferase n=1 Tax=Vibrio metschnikovii TaxID=28172 RepID=UPI001C2FB311|nr:nicotinate-nicotinamide nucleotide adenylyltransferase [Vibrio metschnikovii]
MQKVAVFGSAFNPPSLGHKHVLESLSHFDRVLLIPSISHAWGKTMLDYTLRCRLVDAFIKDLATSHIELLAIEQALWQPDQSVTTYALLTHLQSQWPDVELTFVIGPDNFFRFHEFYRAEEIVQHWSVMVCPEKVNIRSTHIRQAIAAREDIQDLTTPSVAALLEQLQVYR